jgi:hypothetical protein
VQEELIRVLMPVPVVAAVLVDQRVALEHLDQIIAVATMVVVVVVLNSMVRPVTELAGL